MSDGIEVKFEEVLRMNISDYLEEVSVNML